jgi:hypothetical protein
LNNTTFYVIILFMSEKQTSQGKPSLIDLKMVNGEVVEQVVTIPELSEQEQAVLSRAVSEIQAVDKTLKNAGVTQQRRMLGISADTKQLVSLAKRWPVQAETPADPFAMREPATLTVSHASMDDLIKGEPVVQREISELDPSNYRHLRSPGAPEYVTTDLGRVEVAGSEQGGDYWGKLNSEFVVPISYFDLPEVAGHTPNPDTAQQVGTQALRLDGQQ